jgi:hypothetical protein
MMCLRHREIKTQPTLCYLGSGNCQHVACYGLYLDAICVLLNSLAGCVACSHQGSAPTAKFGGMLCTSPALSNWGCNHNPPTAHPTPITITHLASRRACSQTHHNPPHITITQFRTVALSKSAGHVPKNILDPILIALPQVTHAAPHTTTPTCKQQPETHMINTNHRQRMTPRTNQHYQHNLGTTTHHSHARHHS